MLEANSFLLVRRSASPRSLRQYDLADDDGHPNGRAVERLGPFARFARRLGIPDRYFTTRIDFLEPPDESLVFTLNIDCFSNQMIVRDALGEFVGAIRASRDSPRIIDRHGQILGELHPTTPETIVSIVSPKRELGVITWTNPGDFRLDITEELSDPPITKMLLLAAAVAADRRLPSQG